MKSLPRACLSRCEHGAAGPWLIFGLVNVWLTIRGTQMVRVVSLVVSLAALAAPGGRTIAALAAWLVWPPALLVAWAGARERFEGDNPEAARTATSARLTIAAIIAAVALASVAYRVTLWQQLDQTAALFIGIPALLAIVVVMVVSPRSATGAQANSRSFRRSAILPARSRESPTKPRTAAAPRTVSTLWRERLNISISAGRSSAGR
jgi:hypothetical protein